MSTARVEAALASSPDAVGLALIGLNEDQWFDRKSARISPRKLVETEVGLANAEGGILIVGLNDGQVEGTDEDTHRRNALIRAAVELADPPVSTSHQLIPCYNSLGEADHLLCVRVEPDDVVHAAPGDVVFLRVADSNFKLSFIQRQQLLYDKGQVVYEGGAVQGATVGDLNFELVGDYAKAVGATHREKLLDARGLLVDNTPTIAGCLLFARQPQSWFPHAHVRVSRFLGRERGLGARQQLEGDERIEGPLPEILLRASRLIDDWQPRRRALGRSGRFEAVPLVPADAWLEALVNAVVHRSYSMSGDHIRVDVFDDRIEVESPGRFPGIVDLRDPQAVHRFARNPRIARVLADLHFGQEFGEGIARMFEEMRLAGLDEPDYVQTAGSVRVVLSGRLRNQELDQQLPKEARLVVESLREAGRLSTGDLATVMHVSRPTALRRLNAMQELELIRWVGQSVTDPRAYWTLDDS